MSSNAALSTVRARVRRYLNEASAGFWEDADINGHIADAYKHYFAEYVRLNPEWANRYSDITYTANSEKVSIGSICVGQIIAVEDRTSSQPGPLLPHLGSRAELNPFYGSPYPSTVVARQGENGWWIKADESDVAGVITITANIYLTPIPTSARSLRVHYQTAPQDISGGDTLTTGLPEFVEDCVVMDACRRACLQEGTNRFVQEVMMAEKRMKMLSRSATRGPMRIQYTNTD